MYLNRCIKALAIGNIIIWVPYKDYKAAILQFHKETNSHTEKEKQAIHQSQLFLALLNITFNISFYIVIYILFPQHLPIHSFPLQ